MSIPTYKLSVFESAFYTKYMKNKCLINHWCFYSILPECQHFLYESISAVLETRVKCLHPGICRDVV